MLNIHQDFGAVQASGQPKDAEKIPVPSASPKVKMFYPLCLLFPLFLSLYIKSGFCVSGRNYQCWIYLKDSSALQSLLPSQTSSHETLQRALVWVRVLLEPGDKDRTGHHPCGSMDFGNIPFSLAQLHLGQHLCLFPRVAKSWRGPESLPGG